jgi:flagella basal body P-ring formation protein FlgA
MSFCSCGAKRAQIRRFRSAAALVAAALGLAAQPCLAAMAGAPSVDPQVIRAAVEDAIRKVAPPLPDTTLELEVQAPDANLHFAECPDFSVSVPPLTGSRITAKVSCANPVWAVYVPVRLHRWQMVMVAATMLPPNRPLAAGDLVAARIDTATLPGTPIADSDQAVGKLLRTTVPAGAPLMAAQLEAPIVIHRDQRVVVTLDDGNVVVKTTAIAQQDGRAGDIILLQNPASKKTLRAAVTADGEAEMRL